jgi:hypothetical protein
MVFRSVFKFRVGRDVHGLVALGVLTGTALGPIGCGDDFTGCEATRTCPSKGGDAGAGGESGGGAETGGASGSNTAGSAGDGGSSTGGTGGTGGLGGTAGTEDMGGAGSGGSGDEDTEPPTIVSLTPSDGDEDVERDVTIRAELSEPLDEATVTSSSVTLEGPGGDVSGTLSVDGSVISFAADRPLDLLGTYTLTLNSEVSDLAGNALAESASAEFQVRDGRWGTPAHPFGTTEARSIQRAKGNTAGDLVAGLVSSPMRDAVYGAVYDATAARWTAATELPQSAAVSQSITGLGIDRDKRAAIAYAGDIQQGADWSRFDGMSWSAAGQLPRGSAVAVTASGFALAASADGLNMQTQTMNLSDGTLGSTEVLSIGSYTFWTRPVASLDRLAIIGSRDTPDEQEPGNEIFIAWKSASWSTPEPIASVPNVEFLASDSDEEGNIIVVWLETDEIWSRFYERARDAWTGPQFVGNTSTYGIVMGVDITAGSAVVAVNGRNPTDGMWAAIYQSGVGWLQSSVARLDDRELNPIGISIDPAGNALVVWGPELRYRRYVADIGWQAASQLDLNVGDSYSHFAGAGAPDGSFVLVATDFEANPNGVPMAVRFE